ncbi:hypothetical protein ACQP1G_30205 [Nocardia sp. CA-107356]|uniref:hypothetical protein n=1 Tax=Nocardia sp. CA-107356 TaxID=3239972 RepID=UPI003D915830
MGSFIAVDQLSERTAPHPEQESDMWRRILDAEPLLDSGRRRRRAGRLRILARRTDSRLPVWHRGASADITISITGDPTAPYQGGIPLADTRGRGALPTVRPAALAEHQPSEQRG